MNKFNKIIILQLEFGTIFVLILITSERNINTNVIFSPFYDFVSISSPFYDFGTSPTFAETSSVKKRKKKIVKENWFV